MSHFSHQELEESRKRVEEFYDALSSSDSMVDGGDEDSDGICSARSRRSSVTSIARSIDSVYRNFHFENDRRYVSQRGGEFMLPNDDIEQDRIDIYHQMVFTLLGGELYLSPINNPLRILDVGTGTGVWAIEMASKFPNARVIGTDLSPIQADPAPQNCEFRIEDAELDWPFATNYFDFIHTRQMLGKIEDWPGYFKRAFKHIRPGGWIEAEDSNAKLSRDGEAMDGINLVKLIDLLRKGMEALGRPLDRLLDFARYMREAGCVDVQVSSYRLPVGTWPEDSTERLVGRYNILNMLEGIEGYCFPILTRGLKMDVSEVKQLVTAAEKDVQNRNKVHRLYFTYYVIRGRKPEISPPPPTV